MKHIGLADLAHISAEVSHRRDDTLTVHDTAHAEGIAHALIHAVLEGDVYVRCEGLQPAHAYGIDDVSRAPQSLASVGRRLDFDTQTVLVNVPLAQPCDHVQVLLVDVGESDLNVGKLRNRQDVCQQCPGKAQAARADEGDFKWHGIPPDMLFAGALSAGFLNPSCHVLLNFSMPKTGGSVYCLYCWCTGTGSVQRDPG